MDCEQSESVRVKVLHDMGRLSLVPYNYRTPTDVLVRAEIEYWPVSKLVRIHYEQMNQGVSSYETQPGSLDPEENKKLILEYAEKLLRPNQAQLL